MHNHRTVVWAWQERPGLDVVIVRQDDRGHVAVSGHVVTSWDGRVLELRYRLACDPGWVFRRLTARVAFDGGVRQLNLRHDGEGWMANGVVRPDLVAAVDIDIMGTPLTNTLPIRRVPWSLGASHPFTMAYVQLPDLIVAPVRQRYTALPAAGRFLYETLPSVAGPADHPQLPGYHGVNDGFTAELQVDDDGLVVSYPPYWRRVAAD